MKVGKFEESQFKKCNKISELKEIIKSKRRKPVSLKEMKNSIGAMIGKIKGDGK